MPSKAPPESESLDRDWPFTWLQMEAGVPRRKPAPLAANEAERLAALTQTEILDSLPEQAYDDLVMLASQICGTPIALVSLVDQDRQWFKAKVGLQTSETHRDLAFCAHAILVPDDVFSIHDAQRDERFLDNPMVTGAPHVRFYAGASIVTDDGEALGTVCVIDHRPRTLDDAQKRCLQVIARQASALLKARHAAVAASRRLHRQQILTDEARLKQERGAELLDLVLQGGEFGMWDLHVTSGQWTINEREREMLGLDEQARSDRFDWRTLVHPDDWPAMDRALEDHLATHSSHYAFPLRMRHSDGRWISLLSRAVVVHKNAAGRPIRIVGTHQDVSEREETVHRLDMLAQMDALTGLANRRHFEARMEEVMARTRRASLPSALLALDIDRFRAINADFGLAGGDAVLHQFASRLRSCVREIDLVARHAGDAFVVVLEGLANDDHARKVAGEILTGLQLPFRVGTADVLVSASIGLTHFTGHGESLETVLSHAEAALHTAKQAGGGAIRRA